MLDIKFIRENPEIVKKGISAKQLDANLVDEVLKLDEKRSALIQKLEAENAEKNKIAKEMSQKQTQELRERGRIVKAEIQSFEADLRDIEEAIKRMLYQIPNLPADDVKVGKDETGNEVIRKWREPQKFSAKGGPASGWDFQPRDHIELGESLDIIDIKRAAKVSGTRFNYLKNEAVILEFALVQLAFEILTKEGFVPIIPPVLIKKEVMRGMGYLEHGGEQDMYIFDEDGLVLVGTSEQSLGPMHMGEVLEGTKLPLRYTGFSTCFRREAGSYGKDTKGILRVHQFDKVEMFSFTKPENSDKEHDFFLSLEEKLFQALEIPYQVVKMCSGDLGAPVARKYDIEAWMPGQGVYREVTSTSTCTDFQAKRLDIKYKDKDKIDYVHTLNGTAFAIGRTLIAILENYQQEDGSVLVPKVLQKYTGFDKISPKKS